MRMMRFLMVSALVMSLLLALAGCGGGGGGGGGGDDGGSAGSTAPEVLATNPSHLSSDVPTNRSITATFNTDMNAATINANTFLVENDSNGLAVTGSIYYDADSRTAIFDGGLSAGTSYTVTLTNAITDIADNRLVEYDWQFSTGTVTDTIPPTDTTPPTVRFTNPANAAIDVPLNTALSVTFSESIDPTTITSQTVSLRQDGVAVESGVLQIVGTTVTFRPAAALVASTLYTATITTGVEDLAGNSLAANYSWSFTTTSGVDVTPPQVLSVEPPDGAQNVPLDAVIVVNYNEPITPFEFGLLDNRPVTVSFNSDYTTVTLTPTAGLNPGVTYTASVQSRDVAGNRMPVPFVWSFATVP